MNLETDKETRTFAECELPGAGLRQEGTLEGGKFRSR